MTYPNSVVCGLAMQLTVVTAVSAQPAMQIDALHKTAPSGVAGLILSMSSTSSATATL